MFPLLIPLGMAAAAAVTKGVQAASQKDASDYTNEVKRHDLPILGSNYVEGRTSTYNRYDPATGTTASLVDRGSNADTYSALSDANSSAARAFELGGRQGEAGRVADYFRAEAENAANMAGQRIDYGADNALANTQLGLAASYRDELTGNSPSVAALQSNLAQQQNLKNSALASAVGNPGSRRMALMQAGNFGSQLAFQGANARSSETLGAGSKLAGLQNQMAQTGMEKALNQTKLDSQVADYNDQLMNKYYGLQQSTLDAQTKAQQQRGMALQRADQGRKDEVFNEARGSAERTNRDTNMVLGSLQAGFSSGASLIPGAQKK